MGAAVSEPVSHVDLQNKTIRTRALMNVILQYMLNQVSIKDFATLSNPAECKKYVVFMANNLFQYFHKIRVLPVMDQRGFLAFRKLEDLQKDQEKMTKEQDAQKQSLCLSLSYFYTRIFQIYGALALTLIDDVQYMSATGAVKLGLSDSLYTPGESQQIVRPRSRMGGGGPGQKELGNFYFLTGILQSTLEDGGYRVMHDTWRTSSDEIFFGRKEKEQKSDETVGKDEGRFLISYPGIPEYARWNISASRAPSTNKILITFGEVTYSIKRGEKLTAYPPVTTIRTKEILIEPEPDNPAEYRDTTSKQLASVIIKSRLGKILDFVKTKVSSGTTTTTTSDDTSGIRVDNHLSHTRLRDHLTTKKPPGHCVARALQLLRTPVLSDKEGVSYICKVQFYETAKGLDRGGLPQPDGLLTSDSSGDKTGSAGLAAFSQLFYDVVGAGSKLVIGTKKGADGRQPSSFEQYTRFIRLMSHVFEDNKSESGEERTDKELQDVGLDGLQNKRDAEKCKGIAPNDITVSANVAQKVQNVVLELFKIQFYHASECGKIMAMLFDIKYDAEKNPIEIGFSANLLKQGFPELERINYLAREVLLKYYARCEGTYKEGMDMVLNDRKKRRDEATKATLTSTPIQATQATQATQPASRNAKGQLVAPGTEHIAVQAPPAPVLKPTLSAPLQTAPTAAPLLQLKPALTTPAPTAPIVGTKKKQKGGRTRKRSTHHTVTATKC